MDLFDEKEVKTSQNKNSKVKTRLKLFGLAILSLLLAVMTVVISAL